MSVSAQPRLAVQSAVREAVSFADTALALAGHTVTDAHIRDLLEQCLSGQISDAEYITQVTEHIDHDTLKPVTPDTNAGSTRTAPSPSAFHAK